MNLNILGDFQICISVPLISLVNKNSDFKRRNIYSTEIIWEEDTGEFSSGEFSSGEFTAGELLAGEFDDGGFSTGVFSGQRK